MSRSLGAVPPRYPAPPYGRKLDAPRGVAVGAVGGAALWVSGILFGLMLAGVR